MRETLAIDDLAAGDYYLAMQWFDSGDQGTMVVEAFCGDWNWTFETTDWDSWDSDVTDWDTDWDVTEDSDDETYYHSIECGETVSGEFYSHGSVAVYNFTLSEEQDVIITNCHSEFDTVCVCGYIQIGRYTHI